MLEFAPVPGMALTFGDQRYEFLPHPALPAAMNEVWVVEGGEALVYPLQEATSGVRVALKLMKAAFRGPIVAYSVATLTPLASRPGFRVADRVLLTRERFPAQVAQFPALEHAVIMPWVAGVSWASCLGGTGWPGAFTPRTGAQLRHPAGRGPRHLGGRPSGPH